MVGLNRCGGEQHEDETNRRNRVFQGGLLPPRAAALRRAQSVRIRANI